MAYYEVNASLTFPAWTTIEADSPEAALEEARGLSASQWEKDDSAGTVAFDVTPEVALSELYR